MIIDFLKERKSIVQIIFVSIVLAFGVRFIGQGLSELFGFVGKENIYFGLFFILLALLFFSFKLYNHKDKKYIIRGFILYDKSLNQLVSVPGYEYSEKFVTPPGKWYFLSFVP